MKHVMYGERSLLLDDEVVDRLFEYALLLVDEGGAGAVTVRGISPDGNEVDVTLLLADGAAFSAESTNSSMRPPDNSANRKYLEARIDAIRHPPSVQPETDERCDEMDEEPMP